VAALRPRETNSQKSAVLKRLQLLRLLKSGQINSREKAAELVVMSTRHASCSWKIYQQEGLAGLCDYQPGSCKEKLTAS